MITLVPTRLHWLSDAGDDPTDLCALSPVDFRVGSAVLVSPESGDWVVSCASLFLLRTLNRSHSKSSPVGEQMFPCCADHFVPLDNDDVWFDCCPAGLDIEVIHNGSVVTLRTNVGAEYLVPFGDWHAAVLAFSDAVRAFVDAASTKIPAPHEQEGYECFLSEWARRRSEA